MKENGYICLRRFHTPGDLQGRFAALQVAGSMWKCSHIDSKFDETSVHNHKKMIWKFPVGHMGQNLKMGVKKGKNRDFRGFVAFILRAVLTFMK